jgi:methylated-DNA-protein-cysteine methyltransferase-like protein
MDRLTGRQELYRIVARIPKGRCASYGALGRFLPQPVSGYVVGRWMASASEDVPWWRVVSKDGTLVVARRDPELGRRQRELLEREGVPFEADQVAMDAVRWDPFDEL